MARTMSTMFWDQAPSNPTSWLLSICLASNITSKAFVAPLFRLFTLDKPGQCQTVLHSQGLRCRHSTQGQEPCIRLGPLTSPLGTDVTHIALKSDRGVEEDPSSNDQVEAFLLVQSSVGGKGADGRGQPFQSPRPSHCACLHCWSSPEAAPSSPLSRRNRFNTCSRDGEQQITHRTLVFTWMDQSFNAPGS